MAKDGKAWFGPCHQQEVAERIATKLKPEHKALRARLVAKWRAK